MKGPLPIVMYARPDCEDSALVRDRLRALGIPFGEIDIDEDEAAARYVERLNRGFRSTPTLIFGDEEIVLVEPTVAQLDEALRRAGYAIPQASTGQRA